MALVDILSNPEDIPDNIRQSIETRLTEAQALYEAGDLQGAGRITGELQFEIVAAVSGGATVAPKLTANGAGLLRKLVLDAPPIVYERIRKTIASARAIDARIAWDGGIKNQGMPWEDFLEARLTPEVRLPQNYKTFDFYDRNSRLALSAKTLNTVTEARLNNPSSIYSTVKSHVDKAADFTDYSLREVDITSDMIQTRRIELAVPYQTTVAQWEHLSRVVEYGRTRGVDIVITRVK